MPILLFFFNMNNIYIYTIINHPPCRVEMKLTLSLFCKTAYSLSSNSQSTSLINTRIPGLKFFYKIKKSSFFWSHLPAKWSINSLIFISFWSNSSLISFYPLKHVSNPPPKSTSIFIYLLCYIQIFIILYIKK